MSKYLKLSELNISDQAILVETLNQDCRWNSKRLDRTIDSHATAQPLIDWHGKERPETAEVIMRRNFVGFNANDIGFKRQPNGNFLPIISENESGFYNGEWTSRLSQRYGQRKLEQQMKDAGYVVESKQEVAGEIETIFSHQESTYL